MYSYAMLPTHTAHIQTAMQREIDSEQRIERDGANVEQAVPGAPAATPEAEAARRCRPHAADGHQTKALGDDKHCKMVNGDGDGGTQRMRHFHSKRKLQRSPGEMAA